MNSGNQNLPALNQWGSAIRPTPGTLASSSILRKLLLQNDVNQKKVEEAYKKLQNGLGVYPPYPDVGYQQMLQALGRPQASHTSSGMITKKKRAVSSRTLAKKTARRPMIKDKPLCEFCGKMYARPKGLRAHQNRLHNMKDDSKTGIGCNPKEKLSKTSLDRKRGMKKMKRKSRSLKKELRLKQLMDDLFSIDSSFPLV